MGARPGASTHALTQPGEAAHPGAAAQSGIAAHPGTIGANRIGAGAENRIGTGANAGNRVGQTNNAAMNNRSPISSRTTGGRSVNVGNQTINLANNNYRASFANHPFYHGYWNGNGWGGGGFGRFGGYGFGPFGYGGFGYGPFGYGGGFGYGGLGYGGFGFGRGYFGYPLGWGLGAWGLGSLLYGSGYLGYNNPYYGGGGGGSFGSYSYAQPIPVSYGSTSATAATDGTNPADALLNDAIAAFKQGDYDTALTIVNRAITQYASDSVLHEFRALVLFAKGDYRESAATLHSVLAVGPGWDWTTMSSLYPSIAVYTDQLRALENYVRSHPQDGAARFVLAYHYTTAGHTDAAARQLEQVVQLVSNDRVAADLLRMLKPPSAGQSVAGQPGDQAGPTPRPPAESTAVTGDQAQPAPKPIDPAMLVGTWSASKPDGSKFELALNKDSTFRWKFTQGKQTNDFTGKYTVEGNVLALERKEGGALVGEVSPEGNGKFKFKAVGGPPDDPGLDFQH
jgi:hypothetical protein